MSDVQRRLKITAALAMLTSAMDMVRTGDLVSAIVLMEDAGQKLAQAVEQANNRGDEDDRTGSEVAKVGDRELEPV